MSMQDGVRTRFATLLILLLVLATGSVVGVALDRHLGARRAAGESVASERDRRSEENAGGEERATEGSRNRRGLIVEQVGLTERQHAQVDSIVSDYRQRVRDLRDEIEREIQEAYQPRYGALLEEVRVEIKDVLTPDQRSAYDSLLVEYDRRRQERHRADSISDSRG